jgi:hypothetical protein
MPQYISPHTWIVATAPLARTTKRIFVLVAGDYPFGRHGGRGKLWLAGQVVQVDGQDLVFDDLESADARGIELAKEIGAVYVGMYDQPPPIRKDALTGSVVRCANRDARGYVAHRIPFQANNLHGTVLPDGTYAVFSYRNQVLYLHANGAWIGVSATRSESSEQHRLRSLPVPGSQVSWVSEAEIAALHRAACARPSPAAAQDSAHPAATP